MTYVFLSGSRQHPATGVVPFTEIPLLTLIAALLALVVMGNLLASIPAMIAARTRAALFLRAD